MDLKKHIRTVADFPTKGILFYDISTLMKNREAWKTAIDQMADTIKHYDADMLFGVEARGFLLAAPIAYKLNCGVGMIRKKSKLPGKIISHSYQLEYGFDTIEIQADAMEKGGRAIIIDDFFATGGTMTAAIDLVKQLEVDICAVACLAELTFLKGRTKLQVPLKTLIAFDE